MDFNQVISREGTNALKLEFRERLFGTNNVLPLWVADMDFAVCEEIGQAICKRAEHPVFGYTIRDEEFYQSIVDWVKNKHDWEISENWVEASPGVVPTLILSVLAFTEPGDKIVIQPPVYPPFFDVIKDHQRVIKENPLVNTQEGYRMDFDHLDQVTSDPDVKMLIFCNPHNPVGRVWTSEELKTAGEICLKNNVLVISDEIHADLVFSGHTHIPMASVSPELAENTITCMAPSKTFNIAGLNTAYFIASNPELLRRMRRKLQIYHLFIGNMFGAEALKVAYQYGKPWLDEVLTYLEGNIDYVKGFLNKNMPEVKVHRPEATFLMWLDFSEWGFTTAELRKFMVEKARLGLNDGPTFGIQGKGFQRLNIASPRSVIEEAMERLLNARNLIR
ncbi:MalY/PatB family protein [Thermophagus sp. OGC60D27]|uniref:MalY/PatB family protein n=1 Tax=Thermophagus sp. OGC60D27 TaxID=3458415 RepID=UPI004037C18D